MLSTVTIGVAKQTKNNYNNLRIVYKWHHKISILLLGEVVKLILKYGGKIRIFITKNTLGRKYASFERVGVNCWG